MTGIQESHMDVRVGSMLQNRDLTRRQALLGSAAIGLAAAGTASAKILPRKRAPHILFILADDLGYAAVSCYGRRDYVTPAIDSDRKHVVEGKRVAVRFNLGGRRIIKQKKQ